MDLNSNADVDKVVFDYIAASNVPVRASLIDDAVAAAFGEKPFHVFRHADASRQRLRKAKLIRLIRGTAGGWVAA